MNFIYQPSHHDRALDELFGSQAVYAGPSTQRRCVIIAFVNRSGSNHIADALMSTGEFAGLEEILNEPTIRFLTPKYGSTSFPAYLERVYSEQCKSPGLTWGFKAGWMQLAMLMRTKIVPNMFRPTLILVRRRDIIAQAVSFYIADQTSRWTSLVENKSTEPRYNGQELLSILRGLCHSYAMLEQVALCSQLPSLTIIYEDFLDRPNEIISQAGLAINGRALLPRLDRLRLSMQRNELNHAFRARFLEELASMSWMTAPAT